MRANDPKAHTLESIATNDARDMGVGLEDLTRARIADAEGNELPANTDGHIHFFQKDARWPIIKKISVLLTMSMALGGTVVTTAWWMIRDIFT